MLSPYASMVEKLHRDIEKEKVTMLKIERAGDVLADAVSLPKNNFFYIFKIKEKKYFLARQSGSIDFIVLQGPGPINIRYYARR